MDRGDEILKADGKAIDNMANIVSNEKCKCGIK